MSDRRSLLSGIQLFLHNFYDYDFGNATHACSPIRIHDLALVRGHTHLPVHISACVHVDDCADDPVWYLVHESQLPLPLLLIFSNDSNVLQNLISGHPYQESC